MMLYYRYQNTKGDEMVEILITLLIFISIILIAGGAYKVADKCRLIDRFSDILIKYNII